jgi:hypothetical protein
LSNLWTNKQGYQTALNYYFTGINSIYQYNKLLSDNGYYKLLDAVPIEDSGDSGTIHSHIEEGIYFNVQSGVTYTIPQMRANNKGIVFPAIQKEIMSGYLDSNNYITILTLGILQDLEFTINLNSSWVYLNSIPLYPSVTYENSNLTTISNTNTTNTTNNTNNTWYKKYKCNCCNNDFSINSMITMI